MPASIARAAVVTSATGPVMRRAIRTEAARPQEHAAASNAATQELVDRPVHRGGREHHQGHLADPRPLAAAALSATPSSWTAAKTLRDVSVHHDTGSPVATTADVRLVGGAERGAGRPARYGAVGQGHQVLVHHVDGRHISSLGGCRRWLGRALHQLGTRRVRPTCWRSEGQERSVVTHLDDRGLSMPATPAYLKDLVVHLADLGFLDHRATPAGQERPEGAGPAVAPPDRD